jgi:chloramphenicol-sensitive protein RarD
VLVVGESMPAVRWLGFGLVWVALAILTVDLVRATRAAAPEPRVRIAGRT